MTLFAYTLLEVMKYPTKRTHIETAAILVNSVILFIILSVIPPRSIK